MSTRTDRRGFSMPGVGSGYTTLTLVTSLLEMLVSGVVVSVVIAPSGPKVAITGTDTLNPGGI